MKNYLVLILLAASLTLSAQAPVKLTDGQPALAPSHLAVGGNLYYYRNNSLINFLDSLKKLFVSTETDPVFTAWNKSTGISITESQISDLSHFVPSSLLSDYGFTDNSTNWNTAYSWGDHGGLYDLTGTADDLMDTHQSTYNHGYYNTAYTHSQTTTGNPHSINLTDIGESYSSINYWTLNGSNLYYNSGNIGVGTINPLTNLHIYSSSSPQLKLESTSTGTSGVLMTNTASGWNTYVSAVGSYLVTNTVTGSTPFGINPLASSNSLIIQSTGVGIGTSSPVAKLGVYNNASIGTWGSHTLSNATLRLEDNTSNLYMDGNAIITNASVFNIGSTNVNGYISFGTNDSEKMRITASGDIGINTNAPDVKLTIQSTDNSSMLRLQQSSGTNYLDFSNIAINMYRAAFSNAFFDIKTTLPVIGSNIDAGSIKLSPNGTPVLTAFVNGNVGINTSVADKQVEINSATGANLRLTNNDANGSAANYADFATSSTGNLTITPSGNDVIINSDLLVVGVISTARGDFQIVETDQIIFTSRDSSSMGGSSTIDCTLGNLFVITPTSALTLDYSNAFIGTYLIEIIQGATGYSVGFATGAGWMAKGGIAPAISSAANSHSLISCYYNGWRMIITSIDDLQDL